jgi:hypothetical protein
LYGQSVGSGPTLDLAFRLNHIRAVILHSAILSGLRVMYSVKKTYFFDIYKVCFAIEVSKINNLQLYLLRLISFSFQNIDKIPHVKCPVLVIHVSSFIYPCAIIIVNPNSFR